VIIYVVRAYVDDVDSLVVVNEDQSSLGESLRDDINSIITRSVLGFALGHQRPHIDSGGVT
jgi:hypothetical protein